MLAPLKRSTFAFMQGLLGQEQAIGWILEGLRLTFIRSASQANVR
jgi:hypothetical protein